MGIQEVSKFNKIYFVQMAAWKTYGLLSLIQEDYDLAEEVSDFGISIYIRRT
jgi:hypothetical protein